MSMIDRFTAFEVLCGLVLRRGGEDFYGHVMTDAADAFKKSLIGSSSPNFWMEVPLLGDPGFDLHVYYNRSQVQPHERFADGCGFGMQGLFDWFFAKETGGVGVGFAHDLRESTKATGVYVNFNMNPLKDPKGFFSSLGVSEAYTYLLPLMKRLPKGWNPWYIGLFPDRAGAPVRLGAFIDAEKQEAYAHNVGTLEHDLARVGFDAVDNTMLTRISEMAAFPYVLELQLDVTDAGIGDTLGADLTLGMGSAAQTVEAFESQNSGAHACELLESWGATDARWQKIPQVSIAKKAFLAADNRDNSAIYLFCLPRFIKAKWKAAKLLPAKVYFECGTLFS